MFATGAAVRKKGEIWILGFAAERMGISGVRQAMSRAAAWSETPARHPLAVRFCSQEHWNNYLRALFLALRVPANTGNGNRGSNGERQVFFEEEEGENRTSSRNRNSGRAPARPKETIS